MNCHREMTPFAKQIQVVLLIVFLLRVMRHYNSTTTIIFIPWYLT